MEETTFAADPMRLMIAAAVGIVAVSYTHLRAFLIILQLHRKVR